MTDLRFTLPDKSELVLPAGTTGRQIAASIGAKLAAAALGVAVDGEIFDLDRPLAAGGAARIITAQPRGVKDGEIDRLDREALALIRHSASHVMAEAIVSLFPEAKLVYGPPVENGFYYDIDLDRPLGSDDFPAIEAAMAKIVAADKPFRRIECTREEAMARVAGDAYKTENLRAVPEGEVISFYRTGDDPGAFTDLCRGPHVPSAGRIGAFKLMQVSGAYLHGDEKQKQLKRVYGTAWPTKTALEAYLERLKLAQERDHRKLGQGLEIFSIADEVGSGLILWLPNGAVIRQELEALAAEREFLAGYKRVATPHITKAALYHRSGHLPYYQGSMYPPMTLDDDQEYYLKPMNCPHHHMIYLARPRSYRELPLRLAEYGDCYRYEKSGELAGLLRVRGMCMNDAHIYCSLDQVREEFLGTINLSRYYYEMFRIKDFWIRLSLHSKDKDKYIANEDLWEKSEEIVRDVLKECGLPFEERTGEAAFYGPKIDYQLRNVIGREETASTTQLDFAMPERFDLVYTAPDGTRRRPLVIHRAPLGTHERMIAFLLEHLGGAFPTWLAPVQVVVIPVAERFERYARDIAARLRTDLLRAEVDDSADSFNKKIRNAVTGKTPNVWIVGGKEQAAEAVTWRRHCVAQQATMKLAEAYEALAESRRARLMDNFPDVHPRGWENAARRGSDSSGNGPEAV